MAEPMLGHSRRARPRKPPARACDILVGRCCDSYDPEVRPLLAIVLLLVPPACSSAPPGETDASGALVDRAAPAPYHAEVIVLPAPLEVRPLAEPSPRSVLAGSFESASAACNGWETEGADAIRSVPAHSGDYACRVCATGEGPALALQRRSAGPLGAGRYVLRAWVRNRPRRAAPPVVLASLEAATPDGVVTATSLPVTLGDAYAEVLVPIELPRGATSIRARIGAVASAAECLLVDDVLLSLAP
jgi:hypothetical protein